MPDDRRPRPLSPAVVSALGVSVLVVVAAVALVVRRGAGSSEPAGPVITASQSAAPSASSHPRQVGPPLQPVALTPGCASRAGPLVRVMQFNIRSGHDDAGDLRLARIAAEIEVAHPDLVSLNEVDDGTRRSGGTNEASYLAEATGLHAVFGPTLLAYDGGRFGNAILSRYPVVESHNTPLPQVTDFEARALLTVTVRVGDRTMSFSSLHLSAGQGGTADRLPEAEAVGRVLRAAPHPTVVAGDLNSVPTDPPVQILRHYLLDAQQQAGTGQGLTTPEQAPTERIDYVLYDAHFTAVPHSTHVLPSAVSDHRSVVTDLTLDPRRC